MILIVVTMIIKITIVFTHQELVVQYSYTHAHVIMSMWFECFYFDGWLVNILERARLRYSLRGNIFMLSIVPKKNRPSLAGFSVDFLLPYYPVSHLSSRSIQGQCALMGLVFNFFLVCIYPWLVLCLACIKRTSNATTHRKSAKKES